MKLILGILLIIAGIALGLYVGVGLLFVGGVVQIIDAAKVDPIDSSGVAWGIVRMLLAVPAGVLAGLLVVLTGIGVAVRDEPKHDRQTAKQVEGDYRRSMR